MIARSKKKNILSSYRDRGGIGKATARLLATRGVHLALHYFSQHDGATALVEELRVSGVRVAAFQADLANFDAVRALHAKVVEELGHPDIFYSNAAMAGTMLGIKAKIEDAVWMNLRSVGGQIRAALSWSVARFHDRGVLTQGYGRIVFCSSIAAAAIHGLMHWIARQYSKKGIVGIVISVRYAMLSWFTMSDLQCRCPGPNRQHGHVQ
ncbi:hypothetical protein BJV77DRAFT_1037103 [Russula vinacea]|nr:hypothetical protein BJV77DRAFT_1037103 [Russula vinacea]